MKLKESIVRNIIQEELYNTLVDESKASEKAKQMGLNYLGFGRYGDETGVTHISQNGNLVPKKDFKSTGSSKQDMATSAEKNARSAYPSRVARSSAGITDYDPMTNRLSSKTAASNREYQQDVDKLRKVTGTDNVDDPLLKGKNFVKQGDLGYFDVDDRDQKDPNRKKTIQRTHFKALSNIKDKVKNAFGQVRPGTTMPLKDFISRSGMNTVELKFANLWNNKYHANYDVPSSGFRINKDKTVTYMGDD